MSKRNFTLLIIVVIIILAIVFGFLLFRKGMLPTDTGTIGTNFLSRFNPFGKNISTSPNNPSTGETPNNETPPDTEIIKLRKVSSMPVAGYTEYSKERLKDLPTPAPIVDMTPPTTVDTTTKKPATTTKPTPPPTEFVTALRYVARATGNIYQTFADKIEEKQFTTTTIPQVYESYLGNKAMEVIMRYLKPDNETIETFLGNLPVELLGGDTTGNTEVKGAFLPDNITDMSISPDASKIFYLLNVTDNMAVGTILNLADSKKTQVFTSPYTEWLSSWPNNGLITLTTKPASNVPGYVYGINTNTKSFTQLMGNINGLTTLTSPDGKLILYGTNNGLLYIYHTDTRTSDLLGVKTLPEKCVWSNMGYILYCSVPKSMDGFSYPDIWYQGETSFSDQLWKIDMVNGNTTMLVDPLTVTGGEDFDGIKLALDAHENYLFFVNKKDSFLWEFELSPPTPSSSPAVTTGTPATTPTPAPKTNVTTPPTPVPPTPKTYNLSIHNYTFSETPKTINKGDTIVWTNQDTAPHTITGDNGGPNSGTLNTGDTYSFTFSTSGTFPYHCTFHPMMKGTVVVK